MKLPLLDYALLVSIFMAFVACVCMALGALKAAVLPKWYERSIGERAVHAFLFVLFSLCSYVMWEGIVVEGIKYVRTAHGW